MSSAIDINIALLINNIMKHLLKISLAILLLELALLPLFSDPFNYWAWKSWAASALVGNYYPSGGEIISPYPPLAFLVILPPYVISNVLNSNIAYTIFLKLPLIIAGIAAGYLVYRIALLEGLGKRMAMRSFIAFVLNPLLFLVTVIWGTTDVFPMLFTLLAFYTLNYKKKELAAGLFLGAAISFKSYPVFLLPAFLIYLRDWRKAVRFSAASAAIPLAVSIPFLLWNHNAYFESIFAITTAGVERATTGPFSTWLAIYGLGLDANLIRPLATAAIAIGFAALVMLMYLRRTSLLTNVIASLLLLYVTNNMLHENYVLWVLPFVAMLAMTLRDPVTKYARLIWLPPVVYALIFNGMWREPARAATGIFYWTSEFTGAYVVIPSLMPPLAALLLRGILIASFVLLAIVTLAVLLRAPAGKQATHKISGDQEPTR